MVKPLKQKTYFNRSHLIIFLIVFALIGLIILIKSFAAPNPSLPGDLNNDSKVDIADLSLLLSDFGSTDPTKIAQADIVKNNAVDIFDLSALLGNFGKSVSSTPVTFGRTTAGTTAATMTGDFKRGTLYNLSSAGTVSSISAYLDGNGGVSGSQSVRFAIYGSDTNNNPTNLIAQTAVATINSGQSPSWVSSNLTSPVSLAAGNYFLTILSGPTTGVGQLYFDGSGTAPYGPIDTFSDGPSDPWGTPGGVDSRQYSIFATGTSTGGGGGGSGGGSGGTATIFISPSGSDSNSCSSSSPCQSFAKAYSKATAGSIVQVAPGTYGSQLLDTNNAALSASSPVTFQSPAGSSQTAVTVVHIDLKGANNVTFRNMTFGDGTPDNIAWYQIYSSNTLCDQCYIHGMLDIDGGDANGPNGTTNASFTNGTVGNYIARDRDPQVGGFRGWTFTNQAVPTNISFINESFHDVDSDNQTSHTECLQILAVHGLTIKQSKFYNCSVNGNGSKNGIQFSGYQCQNIKPNTEANCGTMNDYWNITIENSMFHGGPPTSNQLGFGWDDQFGDFEDCRNVVVRNNSIIGTVLWGCNNGGQNGGKSAVVVTGNIFSYGNAGFLNSECNATFSYNIYETGGTGCGGSPVYTGAVSYVNRTPGPSFDLHLTPGSFGIGKGNPSNYPTVDYDNQSRPNPAGSTPDAGADEL